MNRLLHVLQVCLVHHSAFHTEGTLSHHLVVYFPGFIWWYIFRVSFGGVFSGFHLVVYFSGFDICFLLMLHSVTVQHSLRSLFFLQ